jgi:hypothetical protein
MRPSLAFGHGVSGTIVHRNTVRTRDDVPLNIVIHQRSRSYRFPSPLACLDRVSSTDIMKPSQARRVIQRVRRFVFMKRSIL